LSLGVVAFSKAQADMLTEMLEVARRDDPILDAFLREGRAEDVFVKNIENVQGDERDTILVSVGYGPHEPDGRLASMNFGPVNAEGGERRLNVVFTRARARCLVFASFDPGDIVLDRTAREGPRILKRFLEFARSGRMDQALPSGGGAESPFEADVAREIAALGYRSDSQVGSAGFRVDLGVRHPERPGRYVLAVECDGATWHGALWARERDRLRQDVLEGLGWQFHRIWSTDWFHARAREIERLRAALADATSRADHAPPLRGANAGTLAPPVAEDAAGDEEDDTGASTPPADGLPDLSNRLRVPAYARAAAMPLLSGEPHDAPRDTLIDLAVRIVEGEGPVHIDEVARRIAARFGKARTGARIQQATADALAAAKRQGRLDAMREFWMTEAQKAAPPVRSRLAETLPTTKAAYLSPLEIRAAAALIVRESGAVDAADMPRVVARLLGYQRLGKDLEARIREALDG
jgi:very-short-patch-repair endonuclease